MVERLPKPWEESVFDYFEVGGVTFEPFGQQVFFVEDLGYQVDSEHPVGDE